MKTISFKNFRRFSDFPEFKFGDITILVGGNNAGKSTLQKALLLVFDNIRSLRKKASDSPLTDDGFCEPQFRFDANEFHDLNLGTFERSLFEGAKDPQMQFSLCVDSFNVSVTIEPDKAGADQPIAKVSLIKVNDTKRHINYTFDFNTRRMRAVFEKIEGNGNPRFNEIQKRISELREQLSKEDDAVEAALANQELEKLLNIRNAFVESGDEMRESSSIETDLNNYLGIKGFDRAVSGALPSYIENIEAYTWTIGAKTVAVNGDEGKWHYPEQEETDVENDTEEDRANEQVLGDKSSIILESASALQRELRSPRVFYIQAHGVVQTMFYTTQNKNDFMAEAIHEFAKFAIKSGSAPDTFLRKWMKEFGIGTNYKIESFGGEGYIIKVETENGWINLADMGMGSNQLMCLLLSLTTIMIECGNTSWTGGKSYIQKLIIIEEPEQNLHPRLQSKLADLFAEVTKDDSYKFLVETHSEYLIRRTQVLVAEMNLSEEELAKQNPFKVYYFPHNDTPYDMKYLPSGRFDNKFGEGFFDESAKWHLEILKREKESK